MLSRRAISSNLPSFLLDCSAIRISFMHLFKLNSIFDTSKLNIFFFFFFFLIISNSIFRSLKYGIHWRRKESSLKRAKRIFRTLNISRFVCEKIREVFEIESRVAIVASLSIWLTFLKRKRGEWEARRTRAAGFAVEKVGRFEVLAGRRAVDKRGRGGERFVCWIVRDSATEPRLTLGATSPWNDHRDSRRDPGAERARLEKGHP